MNWLHRNLVIFYWIRLLVFDVREIRMYILCPNIDRFNSGLNLNHFKQFTPKRLLCAFLYFLSFLPCFFNIFIQTKINLYIKTFGLNCLHFHLIWYYSKLSSYANSQMLTKSDEIKFLKLDCLIVMKLGVSPTTGFNRICMIKLIITENSKSCAVLFVFFISEFAIVKVEVLAHVVQHSGEVAYFGHVFHVGRKWSICEDISLTRMRMNIDEQFQLIFYLWVRAAEVFGRKLSEQFNFG